MRPFLVAVIVLSAACAHESDYRVQVIKKAAFEMNCSAESLTATKIQGNDPRIGTWGVTGCGKRMSYVASCNNVSGDCIIRAEAAATH